jgi:soluble P-type ATPase
MIPIQIPGFRTLQLDQLVLDYNGTLAIDGELVVGVDERLRALSAQLEIHVVTADTYGGDRSALSGLPCKLRVLPGSRQDVAKLAYVRRLGTRRCVCIGNGRNDRSIASVVVFSMLMQFAAIPLFRSVVRHPQ